jgi:D-alanine-D-alanine ligase
MCSRVAIIYNDPIPSRYELMGEAQAVLGVLDVVQAVRQALIELDYEVTLVALAPPLEAVREKLKELKTDLVFNLFEGFDGCPETEAVVAGMLSELGLVYTGCPATALSLALDKARTNALLEAHGLATPRYQVLTPETVDEFHLEFPCIVKPCAEDASHGLSEDSVVTDSASLAREVSHISQLFDGRALVEEFVDGRELNITVLGYKELVVLPVTEILYSLPVGMPKILTFSAKWEPDTLYFESSQPACPAEINDETYQRITLAALDAFKLLNCTGYARVDFRMGSDGIPKIIDVNPNPDLSPDYGVALQAQAAGMGYAQLVERIIQLALERSRVETRNKTRGRRR